jgi:hypothetical protein
MISLTSTVQHIDHSPTPYVSPPLPPSIREKSFLELVKENRSHDGLCVANKKRRRILIEQA